MASFIDKNIIQFDTFIRKNVTIKVERVNTKQDFGLKNQLDNHTLVGILCRRASDTARTKEGHNLLNDAALDATFITIMNGQTTVCDHIPLSRIVTASIQDSIFGYIIPITDFKLDSSGILISNVDAIVDNEYLELEFILIPNKLK